VEKLTRRARRAILAAAAILLAGVILPAAAQQATEAAVKAAFLYKFAGYVEWPESAFPQPDTPFVFGVVGADEVAVELEKLVPGRTINGRRVVVRRIREGEGVRGLHVLFVGSAAANERAVVRAAQAQGALTVTEGGLEAGAAINFVVVEERVAFEVSLEAAERSALRISSRMLAVARRVMPRS
jgi:YfiR/HmsC-like